MSPFRLVKDKQPAPQISPVEDGLRWRAAQTIPAIPAIHLRGTAWEREGPVSGLAPAAFSCHHLMVSMVVVRVSRRGQREQMRAVCSEGGAASSQTVRAGSQIGGWPRSVPEPGRASTELRLMTRVEGRPSQPWNPIRAAGDEPRPHTTTGCGCFVLST